MYSHAHTHVYIYIFQSSWCFCHLAEQGGGARQMVGRLERGVAVVGGRCSANFTPPLISVS